MRSPSQGSLAAAVAGGLLGAAVLFWVETFRDDYHLSRAVQGVGPAFFPRIVLSGMAVLAVVVIVGELRRRRVPAATEGLGKAAAAIALTVLYGLAVDRLGFLLASIGFVATLPVLLGYRRWPVLAVVAVANAVAVWLVFERLLLIILPHSPWFSTF
ncbi:tripartite tricarboxylate transporter TctB family protein [Azospirillum sp. ST 5-10]|uniref:tripartite tricarboxylate transporter TctB family protein n=1 Tax=unclassified Azospirillum TaxID=2630922 RepID=UPI003F49E5F6